MGVSLSEKESQLSGLIIRLYFWAIITGIGHIPCSTGLPLWELLTTIIHFAISSRLWHLRHSVLLQLCSGPRIILLLSGHFGLHVARFRRLPCDIVCPTPNKNSGFEPQVISACHEHHCRLRWIPTGLDNLLPHGELRAGDIYRIQIPTLIRSILLAFPLVTTLLPDWPTGSDPHEMKISGLTNSVGTLWRYKPTTKLLFPSLDNFARLWKATGLRKIFCSVGRLYHRCL